MTKAWTAMMVVRPAARSSEGSIGAHGDVQAGADHEQIGNDDGGGAEQPEFFADGGEDEVVLDLGNAGGVTQPEPGTAEAAPREGERRRQRSRKPLPRESAHGFSHSDTRVCTVASNRHAARAPAVKSPAPRAR